MCRSRLQVSEAGGSLCQQTYEKNTSPVNSLDSVENTNTEHPVAHKTCFVFEWVVVLLNEHPLIYVTCL